MIFFTNCDIILIQRSNQAFQHGQSSALFGLCGHFAVLNVAINKHIVKKQVN